MIDKIDLKFLWQLYTTKNEFRMDKLLLKEQEKFEAVFQNASLGILVINAFGEIVLANSFLLSQFGYARAEELIGKKMEILIPQRYHGNHVNDRNKFIKNPSARPMGMGRDLFGAKKDGTEMPLEISLSSYNNDNRVFSVAFISDISTRIEVQTKLKEQRLALAALNKKMEILNEELEKKVTERTITLQKTLEKLEASKDELGKALSRIASLDLVLQLGELGFRKDLIVNADSILQQEISQLMAQFNFRQTAIVVEDYNEGSDWSKFVIS